MSALKVSLITLLAVIGLGGIASAQPAEQPAGGDEPSIEAKHDTEEHPVDSTTDATAASTEHAPRQLAAGEVFPDPDHTKHFNWFGMSFRGKDQYGGKFGDGRVYDHAGNLVIDPHTGLPLEEEPMSAPFVFMVLNFLLLLGLLWWKGRPIASSVAVERHDLIKNALDDAAKLRKQAADKLAEYETKLGDADAEIKAMVEGMRKDAESDKARILANAERQAAQMKKDAEDRIAAEIELARATLTREVTAASALATEKLLRDKMQAGDQAQLVSSFITDLSATQPTQKERV